MPVVEVTYSTLTSYRAWRGVRDEQLSQVSGVEGGVFIHASGFIGGNKTFQGALDMARKAVES